MMGSSGGGRPLGHRQAQFLKAFRREIGGRWHETSYPGGGWLYGSPSEGVRVAESLERRGLLAESIGIRYGYPDGGHCYRRWRLTDAGREWLDLHAPSVRQRLEARLGRGARGGQA